MMNRPVIRLDVWGGEHSMDHLARMHFATICAAVDAVRREVEDGFLLNVRALGHG
jgi:hypothetical protein